MACALAIYGDDPRGDAIMRFTNDLWKNRVLPAWRQVMGRNGGWHEGGEYVGIGIGQAIYQLPAMWRHATGEDIFATEPGIRGFLDFLVYRTRPDGTHFRWGDAAAFDRIVPDAVPLAPRDAACAGLQPARATGSARTDGLALGAVYRFIAPRSDRARAAPVDTSFRRHRDGGDAQRLVFGRDLRDVQGRRQLLVARASRPGSFHDLQGRRAGDRQRPLRPCIRLRPPHELHVSDHRPQHGHGDRSRTTTSRHRPGRSPGRSPTMVASVGSARGGAWRPRRSTVPSGKPSATSTTRRRWNRCSIGMA